MEMKKGNLQKALLIFSLLFFIIPAAYAKVPDIVLNQKKAVVTIYINDKEGKQITTGTGFIIDKNGIIATNYHVIEKWLEVLESTLLVKMENGAYFPIEELINFDEDNDIALFKVEGKELPTVKIVTDYKPKQGDGIVVIGSPMGLETTVSDGIISNVRGKRGLIQITAPVSMGSSGSPVFNLKGEAIGIATFLIEGGQNLNFAIPVKYVANLLNESKKPKKKIKPALEPAPAPEALAPAPEPVDELEKAKAEVRKNPVSAEARFWLGNAYGKLGMYKEAIDAFKQAIRIKPDYVEAHYSLGFVYGELGMYRETIEAYKQAIRIKPNYAEVHYNLGLAYLMINDRGSALEEYKILKELDSEKANKLFNLIYNERTDEERWKLIYESVSDDTYYFDTKTLTYTSENVVKVWVKHVLSKEQQKKEEYAFEVVLQEHNCKEKRLRAFQVIEYDKNGNFIKSNDISSYYPWEDIIPGSVGEAIQKAVCR